jgi:ornithine lipid ester-linked acyl 2-hydroxylase
MLEKFYSQLLFSAFRKLESVIRSSSLVGNHEFFSVQSFTWISQLEKNWKIIADELAEVMVELPNLPDFHEISPDQAVISKKGGWKTFFFYGYSHKSEKNCAACPKTAALVESIPGMKTAFFSILYPGKHIPAHRGPYNGVLRCHLPLIVPSQTDQCRIRVGSTIRSWSLGQALVFDDSYEHEVLNSTNQMRVVLFIDFVRPLPTLVHLTNLLMIKLFSRTKLVSRATAGQKKWEKSFYS